MFIILVFNSSRKKAIECFTYMLKQYPGMKGSVDRLGRTILHYITQYDIYECLGLLEPELAEYFVKDFNGETCIDYIYIYNSKNCLKALLDKFELSVLVKEIQANCSSFIEKIII
jgi:ankyrin repeat protein